MLVKNLSRCATAAIAVATFFPCLAQSPPDYGFNWATITHPGNRAANQQEAPYLYPPYSIPALPVGAVDHEYRIATTEVSISQWFGFVQAYAPYWDGNPSDPHFTSTFINYDPINHNYSIRPGAQNYPANMSWRVAARYVNWLQNDQRTDRAAFENGVYDTSTFHTNPDHTITDQPAHSPGARFWIPTLDEWTKAVYYDPNRNGTGQEGYWMYPDGTNTPLIPGYPEDGGQTAAGLDPGAPNAHWLDIGSYPAVLTPWNLLDASGGASEWCETVFDMRYRGTRGAAQYDPLLADRLDMPGATPPTTGFIGLRIASAIPTPGALWALALLMWPFFARRRNT
jgi:hypothetical protein